VDYRAMEQAARDAGLTAVTVAAHSEAPSAVVPAVQTASSVGPETGSRLNPDSARTFFDLGMQARREKRFEQAAAHFHQALTYEPSNAEACFQLGIVYKEMGRLTESATWFEKSLGNTANTGSSQAEPVEAQPELEAGPLSGVTAPLNPEFDEDMTPDSSGLTVAGAQTGSDGMTAPGGAQKAQEPAVALQDGAAGSETPVDLKSMGFIQRLRKAVSTFILHTGIPLLRKQVAILTAVTGLLFLLTLIGERLATGKTGLRLFGSAGLKEETKLIAPSPETVISLRQAAQSVERRKQVAQVLARELASKQKAIPAVSSAMGTAPAAVSRGLDLRVGRPASGPVYGADIARRIKEQLATPAVHVEAMAAGFARSRDDVKARLIRQLRTKNWTVSDIAQEMGLSREEVKWALSSGQPERTVERRPSLDEFSQARDLAARARDGETMPVSERDLDHEMEMELQINV
jgi:tetratricopeptide (TPR) repeat protein